MPASLAWRRSGHVRSRPAGVAGRGVRHRGRRQAARSRGVADGAGGVRRSRRSGAGRQLPAARGRACDGGGVGLPRDGTLGRGRGVGPAVGVHRSGSRGRCRAARRRTVTASVSSTRLRRAGARWRATRCWRHLATVVVVHGPGRRLTRGSTRAPRRSWPRSPSASSRRCWRRCACACGWTSASCAAISTASARSPRCFRRDSRSGPRRHPSRWRTCRATPFRSRRCSSPAGRWR